MKKSRRLLTVILMLIVSVFVEIFICNFRYLESLNFKHIENYSVEVSPYLKSLGQNKYLITSEEDEQNYFEISQINDEVKNIYLDIDIVNYDHYKVDTLSLDDGWSSWWYWNSRRCIANNFESSKYLRFHSGGKTQALRFNIADLKTNDIIQLNDIRLNVVRPLLFSKLRFLIIFGICLIFYVFRSKSKYYSIRLDNSNKQKFIIMLAVIVQALILCGMSLRDPVYIKETQAHYTEYAVFAHSLADGKVYFDYEVSDSLMNMKNPYDRLARSVEGVSYLWDHCYFQGKYYMYFGIVPEMIFFLPYYLVTGNDLFCFQPMLFINILISLGVFLLLYEIIYRYRLKVPLIVYLLSSFSMSMGMGTIYLCNIPNTYTIAIASGLLFSIWGLFFWISSKSKSGEINKFRLFLGSLCIALIAGCRPQMICVSFSAFVIFWEEIKGIFTRKTELRLLIIALSPFVFVACFLMYYNFIRFGSALDFGANYNLTTNDMTKRGFELDRIGGGIFYLIFQTPNVISIFPFIKETSYETSYLGIVINDPIYGGIISTNLLLLCSLVPSFFREYVIDRKLYILSVVFTIIAFLVCSIDANGAGIVSRYIADFGFLFFLSAFIFIYSKCSYDIEQDRSNKLFLRIIVFLCFLSLLYNLFLAFTLDSYALIQNNPNLFYKISTLVQFWL